MEQWTDAQLQAWLDQHGGEVGRKDIEDEIDDPSGARDANGNVRKTKRIDRTEITAKDGATLTLRRMGGSLVSAPDQPQYDVVANTPPKPSSAAADPNDPKNRNEAELQRQREANAALPPDQDPAYETDSERRKRAQERIDQQGRDAKEAEARARADAEKNRGTTTLKPDGKGGTIAVTIYPDGRAPTTVPVPGVPSEAQNKYREVKQDPATGKWSGLTASGAWEEIAGGPGLAPDKSGYGVEPAGAPEMTYTAGQLSSGLRQYSSWLSAQVKLHADSGGKQGVSPNDATKLMERRIALAESALKEQEGLANAQSGLLNNATTQRGQSLTETQSRRGAAERLQTNALSTFVPLATKLGPGGGRLLSDAINNSLAGARGYVDSFGGFRESPEVNPDSFPALAELRRSSMAGIQTAANGGPQIFDARAITTPVSPAPDQAAAATNAAAIAANPVFRPQAEVQVPAAANPISGTPITVPPPSPAASAPPPPPVRDDYATNPVPVPVNPPAGQPGNNPNVPVGMAPPSRFMQETRYGQGNYWDPAQRSAELSARLGIPPEVMKAALGGLFG